MNSTIIDEDIVHLVVSFLAHLGGLELDKCVLKGIAALIVTDDLARHNRTESNTQISSARRLETRGGIATEKK